MSPGDALLFSLQSKAVTDFLGPCGVVAAEMQLILTQDPEVVSGL